VPHEQQHSGPGRPTESRHESLRAFGARIRQFRQARGLTQVELAESAGVDRKTISRIENSRFSPSLINVYAIADALDVEARELL
jgi:transcriptional regulator with XRE-family HTH domain